MTTTPETTTPGRVHTRAVPVWPVWLLAAPAAVAIWSGWVGLGQMAGFGIVHPLPGIADGFAINTAITLPIGMECYAAFALRAWLAPGVPDRARRFARGSAIGALVLGALGQVAYHLLAAAEVGSAPWIVTALVACLPVAVLGMGAALAHLLSDDDGEPAPAEQTSAVPASRTAEVAGTGTAGPPQHRTTGPGRPARTGLPPADRPAQSPRTGQAAPVALVGPGHHQQPARPGAVDRPAATGQAPAARSGQAGTDAELLDRLRRLAATEGRPGRNRAARELGVGSGRAARLLEQLDQTTDAGTRRAA